MTDSDDDENPTGYRHVSDRVPSLARLVDEACHGVADIHDIADRITTLALQLTPDISTAAINQLVNLFLYVLSVDDIGSPQPGASLGPLEGPSIFPLALRDADDDIRSLWKELGETVTHPIAVARCADIAFTLRLTRNSRDSAESAAKAYLSCAGGSLRSLDQCRSLLRGWTLARSVGLAALETQLTAAMLDFARAELGSDGDTYAALPLLDAILAPRRKANSQPPSPDAVQLVDQALSSSTHPRILAEVAKLVRARMASDASRVERANRAEINAMLAEAETNADGFVMRFRLHEAASLAHRLGIADLEQVAITRLQAAPPAEWQTFTVEHPGLPEFYVRQLMRPYEDAGSWQEALSAWLHTDSPCGTYDANLAIARRSFRESVVSRLMTRVRFGSGDMPKRVETGDEAALEAHLVRVETLNLSLHGRFLSHALDLIAVRFGIPTQEDLAAFLASSSTHLPWADALATSLRLYWTREYTASAHLSAPKIEAAARALLLDLNEPVYRAAVGDTVGQFAGLGALLPHLIDNDFDRDWERFLRTLLLSDGRNVRNEIAHGFMDHTEAATAALVLRACAVLVLITSNDSGSRDAAAVKAALKNPIPKPKRETWAHRIRNAFYAACRELWR